MGNDKQIPARAVPRGQPASAHAQFLAVLSARRDFDVHAPVQCRHGNFRAQHGLPRRQFGFMNQIVIRDLEIRMFGQSHAQI